MTTYTASISAPGYMPDAEPETFDTAADAWDYLAEERERHENDASEGCSDDVCDPGCPWRSEAELSETFVELRDNSRADSGVTVGSVNGDTPGYHGDHDLGLVYSVETYED